LPLEEDLQHANTQLEGSQISLFKLLIQFNLLYFFILIAENEDMDADAATLPALPGPDHPLRRVRATSLKKKKGILKSIEAVTLF